MRADQERAWHHGNATSPANIDIARKRKATMKPGTRNFESDDEPKLILPQSMQAGNIRIPSDLRPRPRPHLARKGNPQSSVASDSDYQPKRAERRRERRKRIKHLKPHVFEGNAANAWPTEERNHRPSMALPSTKLRGNSSMREHQNPSSLQARSFVELFATTRSQTLVDQRTANADDDRQSPTKSSHDYERFKQWTGLPSGSIAPVSVGINSGFVWSSSYERSATPPGDFNSRQYREPEQDLFDFSQLPLPVLSSSTITSPINNSIDDDLQILAKPSHEYERSRQKKKPPAGSIAGLSDSGFAFLSSGIKEIDKVSDVSKIDGMRHQKLRDRHTFALHDQNSPYNADVRPGASSYWSINEQQAFNQHIKRFGTNWSRISKEIGTKTPTMIKNYYERLLASGRKDLEADKATVTPEASIAGSLASTSLSADTGALREESPIYRGRPSLLSTSGGSPMKISLSSSGSLAREYKSSANRDYQKRVQYTISQDNTADNIRRCKSHFIALRQLHSSLRQRSSGLSRDMRIRTTSHWVG